MYENYSDRSLWKHLKIIVNLLFFKFGTDKVLDFVFEQSYFFDNPDYLKVRFPFLIESGKSDDKEIPF